MKYHRKKKVSNSYHLEGYAPSDIPSGQEYVLRCGDFTTCRNGEVWYSKEDYLLFKKSDVFAKRFYDDTEDIALVALNFVPAVALILFVALFAPALQALLIAALLGALPVANAFRLRKKYSAKKYYVEIADAARFNGSSNKPIVLPDDDGYQGNNWITRTHFFEALKGDDSSTAVEAMKMLASENITEETKDTLYATIYMIGEIQIKNKLEKLNEKRQQASIASSAAEESNKYMAESLRDVASAKYTSHKQYGV